MRYSELVLTGRAISGIGRQHSMRMNRLPSLTIVGVR